MPIPFWAGRYIGLPFAEHGRTRSGLDCWGLVRLVLQEQYGAALPSFATEYRRTSDSEQIAALFAREVVQWDAILPGEEQAGDVIVLRLMGAPMHVGVVLGDGRMLHAEHGVDSAIESYTGARWKDRVFGFYRHRKGGLLDDTTDAPLP